MFQDWQGNSFDFEETGKRKHLERKESLGEYRRRRWGVLHSTKGSFDGLQRCWTMTPTILLNQTWQAVWIHLGTRNPR